MTMPALGESVTEGTVTRWLKQVGDTIEADEPLLEVSTDKVDTEIPSPVAGTVLEIKVAGGRDRRRRRRPGGHRHAGQRAPAAPAPQQPEPPQPEAPQQPSPAGRPQAARPAGRGPRRRVGARAGHRAGIVVRQPGRRGRDVAPSPRRPSSRPSRPRRRQRPHRPPRPSRRTAPATPVT